MRTSLRIKPESEIQEVAEVKDATSPADQSGSDAEGQDQAAQVQSPSVQPSPTEIGQSDPGSSSASWGSPPVSPAVDQAEQPLSAEVAARIKQETDKLKGQLASEMKKKEDEIKAQEEKMIKEAVEDSKRQRLAEGQSATAWVNEGQAKPAAVQAAEELAKQVQSGQAQQDPVIQAKLDQ